MKKGCFYSHQGWTDIINNLSLISYYSKIYDELIVLLRDDAKNMVDYYIKGLNNVHILYVPKYILDYNLFTVPVEYEKLYHGYHDKQRTDKYNSVFNEDTRLNMHIGRGFYEFYDIPYIEKIESFHLVRDLQHEENEYQNFISKYGKEYIVYHEDSNSSSRGIDLNFLFDDKKNCVNLNQITDNIFGYLKIIKEAKEVHFVDSIWASVCYLADCKYNFLENKQVNIYAFKNRYGGLIDRYEDTQLFPIHKTNWNICHI